MPNKQVLSRMIRAVLSTPGQWSHIHNNQRIRKFRPHNAKKEVDPPRLTIIVRVGQDNFEETSIHSREDFIPIGLRI